MSFGGQSERVVERISSEKAPAATDTAAASAKKALQDEKDKKGRLSTILTGGQGATGEAQTNKKTLLGQ